MPFSALYSCALQRLATTQPIVYCRIHRRNPYYLLWRFGPVFSRLPLTMTARHISCRKSRRTWSKFSYHWVPTSATASAICAGPSPRFANLPQVIALSDAYETEPVEFTAQPWFVNAVVALAHGRRSHDVHSDDAPQRLLQRLLLLERAMGRQRSSPGLIPKGPRVIDLDIVLYGSRVIHAPALTDSASGHASAPLCACSRWPRSRPRSSIRFCARARCNCCRRCPRRARWCAGWRALNSPRGVNARSPTAELSVECVAAILAPAAACYSRARAAGSPTHLESRRMVCRNVSDRCWLRSSCRLFCASSIALFASHSAPSPRSLVHAADASHCSPLRRLSRCHARRLCYWPTQQGKADTRGPRLGAGQLRPAQGRHPCRRAAHRLHHYSRRRLVGQSRRRQARMA